MDVAILLSTGFGGEDALVKAPWVRHTKLRVHVASRVHPTKSYEDVAGLPARGIDTARVVEAIEDLRRHAASLEVVYEHEAFQADPDADSVAAEEAWLGVSFAFLASQNRLFVDRQTGHDRRDEAEVHRCLARYVRFFRAFYQEHDVQVLATSLEDDLYCLAAYHVAKRMGVRVVGTLVSRFLERGIMFVEDFERLLAPEAPAKDIEAIRATYDDHAIAGDARKKTQGYWDLRSLPARIQDVAFATTYASFRDRAVSLYPEERLIIPPADVLRRAVDHARRVARRYAVRRYAEGPGDEPYYLFPLHFTDDAQITFKEPFLDQVALVQQIARSLPAGHMLYVKPHPHYFGTDMSLEEVRAMAKHPRIRILSADIAPGPLVRGAEAVVTVNSTTGFEALIQEVPVVTFGHDFYCHEPPCFVVRDLRDLPSALLQAKAATDEDRKAMRDFVLRVRANTTPLPGEHLGYAFFAYTDDDGKAFAKAIEKALKA